MLNFDPSDIAGWASRPDASHQLPALIRRLILATVPGVSLLDIPHGSAVTLPGWDGRLTAPQGNPWAPSGASVWEFSAQQNPTSKANDDYRKRTNGPLEVDMANTTFVFVTPRQWGPKQKWAEQSRSEGKWADVRALDASNLAAWLEQAPAVAGWFAKLIGKLPADGYISLAEWWERWSTATDPNISPELVLAGRGEPSDALARWAQQPPSAYYLKGYTKEEGIGFLAAVAQSGAAEWGGKLMAKAIVVENLDAWRSLERHATPLILIRNFDGEAVPAIAVQAGHHVLTPLDEAQSPVGDGHKLPSPGRDETIQALTAMGLSEERARLIARQTARRLPIIRRRLLQDAGAPLPTWALPQAYSWLSPLVLIGQWDETNQADKEIITEITGLRYDDIGRNIADLMLTGEQPLTRVGQLLRFTCHEEAWELLAPKLTSSEVNCFENTAVAVLGAESPMFEMPPNERYLANVDGKTLQHSNTLRDGIARSLALMGTNPDRARNASNAAHLPFRVVSKVLDGNKEWRIWATLSHQLPTLAEAAPDAFVAAVQRWINEHTAAPAGLFAQEGDFLRSGAPHTGLLFALERVAWSSDHFTPVAVLLARLSEIDPGGQLSNRPGASLAGQFRPWIRFSEATDAHRLKTLQTLFARHPEIGWQTLLTVHPRNYDYVTEREPPYWRPWAQDGAKKPTIAECNDFVAEAERLLLEHVGIDVKRWIGLIEILRLLSPDGRQSAMGMLLQEAATLREQPWAGQLWSKLRKELHRHRSAAPNAVWAMPQSDLETLADAYQELTPQDPATAYGWLFDSDWPDLLEGRPFREDVTGSYIDDYQRRIDEERESAIKSAHQEGGVMALLSIAEAASYPSSVGHSIASSLDPELTLELALQHADSLDDKMRMLAKGLLFATLYQSLWQEVDEVVKRFKADGASPEAVAEVYLAAPPNIEVWEHLADEEQAVQTDYWKSLYTPRVARSDKEQLTYAIRQLLAVGCSPAAADLIGLASNQVSPETTIEVLAALPRDLNAATPTRFSIFDIERLFEKLDLSEGVGDETIAMLELPLIEILQEQQRSLALYREVSRRPELFADLITFVFNNFDEQNEHTIDNRVTDERRGIVFDVLHNLRVPPGLTNDGAIDGQTLSVWVSEAQRLCRERNLEDIGNEYIGQMLANAPTGADGIWPCEPVRELLEGPISHHIKAGIEVGIFNRRGATYRGMVDGGSQEHSLADEYREDAQNLAAQWPSTSQLLMGLARAYDNDAAWHDQHSAKIDAFGF